MSKEKKRKRYLDIIIYPIAIAYSIGQIIKSVCVCQSVFKSLKVCENGMYAMYAKLVWSPHP